jgi:hypothetical protein
MRLDALGDLGWELSQLGRIEEGRACTDAASALARDLGLESYEPKFLLVAGNVHALGGATSRRPGASSSARAIS